MNYMEQVAQMLGVDLGEEFKVGDFKNVFKITKDGMFKYAEHVSDWISTNHTLLCILIGRYEVKKSILDDAEREYLKNVIRPFRKQIISIGKLDTENYECIVIKYRNISGYTGETMYFPDFEKDTMYKGMKADRVYSLEELGL